MSLVRTDPFRDVDRLFEQMVGGLGRTPRPQAVPMDAYRKDDTFLIRLDLPGVVAEEIDLSVEDNVLTVTAERPAPLPTEGVEVLVAERPTGTFRRQVLLGNHLDTGAIEADYEAGVLTVAIPVATHAKPRRIEVCERQGREALAG
jgi:HSP20 family protein